MSDRCPANAPLGALGRAVVRRAVADGRVTVMTDAEMRAARRGVAAGYLRPAPRLVTVFIPTAMAAAFLSSLTRVH